MWLYLSNSFLSIVKPSGNDHTGSLLVRSRVAGDIEKVFPAAEVMATYDRDYAYRAFVPVEEVAQAIAERITAIAYSNFKNSVSDNDRHSVYSSVWSVTRRLQKTY